MSRLMPFLTLALFSGCLAGCSMRVGTEGSTVVQFTGELAGHEFFAFKDEAPGGRVVEARLRLEALIPGVITVVGDTVEHVMSLVSPVPDGP